MLEDPWANVPYWGNLYERAGIDYEAKESQATIRGLVAAEAARVEAEKQQVEAAKAEAERAEAARQAAFEAARADAERAEAARQAAFEAAKAEAERAEAARQAALEAAKAEAERAEAARQAALDAEALGMTPEEAARLCGTSLGAGAAPIGGVVSKAAGAKAAGAKLEKRGSLLSSLAGLPPPKRAKTPDEGRAASSDEGGENGRLRPAPPAAEKKSSFVEVGSIFNLPPPKARADGSPNRGENGPVGVGGLAGIMSSLNGAGGGEEVEYDDMGNIISVGGLAGIMSGLNDAGGGEEVEYDDMGNIISK